AHEDANIIWGMVIDQNLQDRVRVTVIATGFGEHAADDDTTVAVTPIMNIGNSEQAKLETPTFARKTREGSAGVIPLRKLSVLSSSEDEDKYEIPTFLRKQVD
ncbi:MAG: cell division protein FtsZ, partial [Proteobacteria bacterium]